MPPIPPIENFGRRIMICGPSNSGKSTLAVAIGHRLDIPAVHLDTLRHLPNTDWQERPDEDFARLHDAAVAGDTWAMDGNYSKLMPARFARATGIILLSESFAVTLLRYLRRTLFETHRPGALEGAKDSLKFDMIRWIWIGSTQHIHRYRRDLPKTGLPFIELRGLNDLRRLYAAWGLTRG